ncbi:hypothetical protein F7725_007658 [Dissostichus mawsoni]|uniref:SWIM-type domain-containing protein n=1 Tax=Dissostichus mawsoni TaxID=36200 RepID=A0A7J5Y4Z9_DISMA|nr:hypothetical protein F7725_007658 [Dissostichus mawsoni]
MYIGWYKREAQPRRAKEKRGSRCTYPVTSTIMKIVFENCSPVEIAVAECSCVAGTALCNHNVALLFQTAHYSTLNLAAVPLSLAALKQSSDGTS